MTPKPRKTSARAMHEHYALKEAMSGWGIIYGVMWYFTDFSSTTYLILLGIVIAMIWHRRCQLLRTDSQE